MIGTLMRETYTIPQSFEKSAFSHPEKIALQAKVGDVYKSYTYGKVLGRAKNLATFLISEGVKKGDRIAIYAKTCPEWGIAYLGLIMAGAAAVPVDAQLEAGDVRNILAHSTSDIIFVSEDTLPKALKAADGMSIRIINLDGAEFLNIVKTSHEERPLPEICETDIASIVYTSGTTGIPKGVMLSHKNLCFDAFSIIEAGLYRENDNILGVLPLNHTYPFMGTLLAPLFAGATVTYLTVLKGPEIIKTMRDCGITVFIAVPQLFEMLLRGIYSKMPSLFLKGLIYLCGWIREKTGFNLGKILFRRVHKNLGPNLRFFGSGGAKLDPDVAKGLFALGFTILEGYGLTETSPVAAFNPEKRPKIGSVGLPIPGVEIAILNTDKNGIGEVAIKGPIVMQGYYRSPEETEKTLKDGWLLTGDQGYKDKDGYLYITGRLKEVIVLSSGKNIYPEEIEKHYLAAPLIKEICVIGVKNKSGVTESLQAVIVPNLDYLKEQKTANLNEAIRWEINSLSSKLPSYKRIMGYRIVTEPLPRTALGKIRRFMVNGFLKEEKRPEKREISDEDRILMQDPSCQKMIVYLKGITKKEVVNLDDNLELDLGMDSLQRVELVVAMEEMLSTKLPEGFGAEIISVRDLIKKLMELSGKPVERVKVNRWPKLFEAEPDEADKNKVGLKHGIIAKIILTSGLVFLKAITKLIFRLEVRGLENLPRPPYIITPNHTSLVDGFIVAAAVPLNTFRSLYFVAIQEYFDNLLTKAFARLAHVIPIDPESYLYRAMQLSGYILKNSKAICIFPEGGRSIDGKLMTFKKGIGILSKEMDAPLIPTIIDGAFAALPMGAWLPRPTKIMIVFGKPVYPKDIDLLKKPDGMNEYEWIGLQLRKEMFKQFADVQRNNRV